MAEDLRKSRNNPEISATNEKQELKRVDEDLHTMKNRVELLRQQLQKEKDTIKKNKNLVKEVLDKKIQVNRINQLVPLQPNYRLETERQLAIGTPNRGSQKS